MSSTRAAYAGLDIRSPSSEPIIVETAKPMISTIPEKSRGSIANIATVTLVVIIANALSRRSWGLPWDFFSSSSVITICASTPTPIAAIIPAIAARSIVKEPRIASRIINSEMLIATIGRSMFLLLYLNETNSEIASSARNMPTMLRRRNSSPRGAGIVVLLPKEICMGSAPPLRIDSMLFALLYASSCLDCPVPSALPLIIYP